jgi:hypothetical protein
MEGVRAHAKKTHDSRHGVWESERAIRDAALLSQSLCRHAPRARVARRAHAALPRHFRRARVNASTASL